MKRGKTVCKLLVLLLCLLSVFGGCKKSKPTESKSQTKEQSVTEVQPETEVQGDTKETGTSEAIGKEEEENVEETADTTENGTEKKDDKNNESDASNKSDDEIPFDMEEISQQIKINNESIPFPCTLKDLGEGYSFGKYFFPFNEDSKGELAYQGDTNFSINLYNYKDKKPDENALIYYLCGYIFDKFPFEIAGITYGSTTKDLIDTFGEPTYIGGKVEDDTLLYEYKVHNYQYMIFFFDDYEINGITIKYLPDKYLEGRDLYD
jgi:hypothetical protein